MLPTLSIRTENCITAAPCNNNFTKVIEGECNNVFNHAYTLQHILFKELSHRNEDGLVLMGHINEIPVELSLREARAIVLALMRGIASRGFEQSDTVMLLSTTATNELYVVLWFCAFVSSGVRVLLPIFPEGKLFERWVDECAVKAVFIPSEEINGLKDYERLKQMSKDIERLCKKKGIDLYDSNAGIADIVDKAKAHIIDFDPEIDSLPSICADSEAVIFSTSGTTGASKLVTYTQAALHKICIYLQEAGFYSEQFFGSGCFTPLFTHTIGVRSLMSALWTAKPLCLITVDWFHKKPEVARFLLLKMKPGHIVGGPAMFNTLIELYRQFPELKQQLKHHLKCLVSIGSPYDRQTAEAIKTVTGLNLYNAYGTTETQMATFSFNSQNSEGELGTPLPGVAIALKETVEDGVFELHISTPFQSLEVTRSGRYFNSGDLVTFNAQNKTLLFRSRTNCDWIKDGFGIKIPVDALKSYYQKLYNYANHIEWFPLQNKPGLAAIIFAKQLFVKSTSHEIESLLKNINDHLQSSLEPFEFCHRHLERFVIVNEEVPITRKGAVSKSEIEARYEKLIGSLVNPFVKNDKIQTVEADDRSDFYKYVNPQLAELLEALSINVKYTKGKGDSLFYDKNGKSQQVTDFVGGFGSNLLGHNHPALKRALLGFIKGDHVALNNQGSNCNLPAMLAKKLNLAFAEATQKLFKVQLANSGSEAVEMALHHAYYEWLQKLEKSRDQQLQLYGDSTIIDVVKVWEDNMKRLLQSIPAVLVINNGFHGFTSAARSLLNHKKRRVSFSGLLKTIPLFIDDTDRDWKQKVDNYISDTTTTIDIVSQEQGVCIIKQLKVCNVIAAMFEPVMGEGGIHVVKEDVPDYLSRQDFPLIADEIQCGLGRTGAMPAYKNASYYLLGKSLGGGYEKIAAVMIEDSRFRNTFPKYYASTFANGNLAALAAITTMDIIEQNKLAEKAMMQGTYLLNKLEKIAAQYPSIIASVQGKGVMIGIYFNKAVGDDNNVLRVMFEQELLGYLFSAWFFHKHNIRVLPSLSAPNTLRLEPSALIKKSAIDIFCTALDELCKICSDKQIDQLLLFLINDDPYTDRTKITWQGKFPCQIEEPAEGAIKVGFISNFTNPVNELKVIEPMLESVSETGLRILFNKLQVLFDGKPIKILSKNLLGGKIHFTFYLIPYDTAHLESVSRWGKKRFYISKIQEAVNKLADEGVTHVSLGAHASIMADNGLSLAPKNGVKIITGNTLTISSCLFHLDQYINEAGKDKGRINIAVVGASGNIGSGICKCLNQPRYNNYSLTFIGTNLARLQKLSDEQGDRSAAIKCTTDLFHLKEADIVICCTNTNDPIIFPHHLPSNKCVRIIDLSVPKALSEEAANLHNIVVCKTAASVTLIKDCRLQISAHTEQGKIFCCAGEAILDAMHKTDHNLKGHIDVQAVKDFYTLAKAENFFK